MPENTTSSPPLYGRRSNQPHCCVHVEARAVEQQPPLGRREPGEQHRRRLLATAYRQRQRALALVPVGALEDPRLALEPASVGVLDVFAARREDIEDEPPAGQEQLVRRGESPEPVGLGRHVQERAEGNQDERDPFLDGRLAHVAEPQVEQRLDTLRPRVVPAQPRASRPRRRRRSRGCRPWRPARRCGPYRTRARPRGRPKPAPPRRRTPRPR